MKMIRTGNVFRPLALMSLAGGLFICMLWLNLMWLDECASKFALSDRVLRLHRFSGCLLLVQLMLSLGLVIALELIIARKRKTEGPNKASQDIPRKLNNPEG